MKHPDIKIHDWILVGTRKCVVRRIYDSNSQFGVCEVVFNKDKPTTHDVCWNGEEWCFPDRPDFGGYVPKSCYDTRKLLSGLDYY